MVIIRRASAYILLTSIYGFTWLIALLARIIPHRRWKPSGKIAVTGTFFNPNWYLSHIAPLANCGVKEIILIVDEPQIPLERVRFICPPKWLAKILSRAFAKALWMFISGIRYKPDLYMGYHLAPGGCSALIAGKLLGRPSCYQMTGGPVGIRGGGFDAVDSIEGSLGHPSRFIEKLALAVVNSFELVVVRGKKAKNFLAEHGINESVAIITGSVNGWLQSSQKKREIDLIFVGRLSPIKQVHQFIKIVSIVKNFIPDIHAVLVGDGPLKESLMSYTKILGLVNNIEFVGKTKNVDTYLSKSKVFILTSQSEGLSIAMAEAMSVGTVPVVADIGELSDLIINGVNGFLVHPNNVDEYANKTISLLQNNSLWDQFSNKATEVVTKYCDLEVVSGKWEQYLWQTISKASGN